MCNFQVHDFILLIFRLQVFLHSYSTSLHSRTVSEEKMQNKLTLLFHSSNASNLGVFTNVTTKNFSTIARAPKGYWKNEDIQRDALEQFGRERFGVKELDDWYRVNATKVWRRFRFIRTYHGSLSNALKNLYPQHNWDPLRFKKLPQSYWSKEEVQRSELEKLGIRYGVKKLDDWYSINASQVKSELSFFLYYNGSLYNALKKLYPQHDWNPAKFAKVSNGFWTNENAQRNALERLGRERFGIQKLDDWYGVSTKEVSKELPFIDRYYDGYLFHALKKLYPQHDWFAAKFIEIPRGYWMDEKVQREELERVGRRLGVKHLDDWYSISQEIVHKKFNLRFVVTHYKSLSNALQKLYPEHHWDMERFSREPSVNWDDENVQREALERVGRELLGVNDLDDWYSVSRKKLSRKTVSRKRLGFIATHYNGSLFSALKNLYPKHDWDPNRFSDVSRKFWKDENVQKVALDRLGKQLGVEELDDWYKVSRTFVMRKLHFVDRTRGSLLNVLKRFYPQHNWNALLLSNVPVGYWKQPSTYQYCRELVTSWKEQHNIREFSEFYDKLEAQQVKMLDRIAVRLFKGKMKMLEEWFPDMSWQWQYTSQAGLRSALKDVLTQQLKIGEASTANNS